MLSSIRETLATVQNELANGVESFGQSFDKAYVELYSKINGVERLRVNVAPAPASNFPTDAINEIVNTSAGSDLLLKYQTQLEQMRTSAEHGVRLANLCSTRLGRAQQMCRERADAVLNIDTFLRSISDVDKRVDKLQRFCDQTEQAFAHLDALCIVAEAEDEIGLIRHRARAAAALVPPSSPPPSSVFPPSAVQASDSFRAQQEEVMLEEFLTKP